MNIAGIWYEKFITDYIFGGREVGIVSIVIVTLFIGTSLFLILKFLWEWYKSESKNDLKMVIIESLHEEWRDLNRDFSHFQEVEKIIEDYQKLKELRNQLQNVKKEDNKEKMSLIETSIFSHGPGIFISIDVNVLYTYEESKFDSYYHTFIEDLLHSNVYEYKNFYSFYMTCTRYYTALRIFIKTLIDFYDISEKIDALFQEAGSIDQNHKNMVYHDKIPLSLKDKNEGVRKDISTSYKDMKEAEKKMKVFFEE